MCVHVFINCILLSDTSEPVAFARDCDSVLGSRHAGDLLRTVVV